MGDNLNRGDEKDLPLLADHLLSLFKENLRKKCIIAPQIY